MAPATWVGMRQELRAPGCHLSQALAAVGLWEVKQQMEKHSLCLLCATLPFRYMSV